MALIDWIKRSIFRPIGKRVSGWSTFWVLNIAGWVALGVIEYLLSSGEDLSLAQRLRFPVSFAFGFILSGGIRMIYKTAYKRLSSFWSLWLIAPGVSVASAAVWGLFAALVAHPLLGIVHRRELTTAQDVMQEAYIGTFVLVMWSGLYFLLKFRRDLQESRMRLLETSLLANQARLQMLRYQLNPHFFFNSLNSLSALIDENPDQARSMITQLSEFLRYSLLTGEEDEVTLADEIEAMRNYLEVEKTRFEEQLEIDIDIDPKVEDVLLPGFILHPLIENAIKHGLKTSPMPLRVEVQASGSGNTCVIRVSNSGAIRDQEPGPLTDSKGVGIGLENVRQRLSHRFSGHHRFQLSESNGFVHAVIEVDSQEKSSDE